MKLSNKCVDFFSVSCSTRSHVSNLKSFGSKRNKIKTCGKIQMRRFDVVPFQDKLYDLIKMSKPFARAQLKGLFVVHFLSPFHANHSFSHFCRKPLLDLSVKIPPVWEMQPMYRYMSTHTDICTHIQTHVRTYRHMQIHIQTHVETYTDTYRCIQTHSDI